MRGAAMNCKIKKRNGKMVEAELTIERSFNSSRQPVLLLDDEVYGPIDAALNGIVICSCDDPKLFNMWSQLHNQTVGRRF